MGLVERRLAWPGLGLGAIHLVGAVCRACGGPGRVRERERAPQGFLAEN